MGYPHEVTFKVKLVSLVLGTKATGGFDVNTVVLIGFNRKADFLRQSDVY